MRAMRSQLRHLADPGRRLRRRGRARSPLPTWQPGADGGAGADRAGRGHRGADDLDLRRARGGAAGLVHLYQADHPPPAQARGQRAHPQLGAVGRVSPLLRQHRNDPLLPPAPADGGSRDRPVILATLAVPFDPDSARVAIQAAMEGGVKLIVVDAVEMPFWPQSMATRRADLEEESDRAAIRTLV